MYIYKLRSSNELVLQTGLSTADGILNYGKSMHLVAQSLIVGAPGGPSDAFEPSISTADEELYPGAAFVYEETNGQWLLAAQLPSMSGPNSFFGSSVAIWNDTALVGARGYREYLSSPLSITDLISASSGMAENSTGCVFTFKRTDDSLPHWNPSHSLFSPQPQEASQFGYSVMVRNGAIAVGASGQSEFFSFPPIAALLMLLVPLSDQFNGAIFIHSLVSDPAPSVSPTAAPFPNNNLYSFQAIRRLFSII